LFDHPPLIIVTCLRAECFDTLLFSHVNAAEGQQKSKSLISNASFFDYSLSEVVLSRWRGERRGLDTSKRRRDFMLHLKKGNKKGTFRIEAWKSSKMQIPFRIYKRRKGKRQ